MGDENMQNNLQAGTEDASITSSADGNTVDASAGDNTPEDTHNDAYQEIIEQQKTQIDALMQRTEELTKQLNTMLAMGVQISDGAEPDEKPNATLQDDYVSLSELGMNIGKSKS